MKASLFRLNPRTKLLMLLMSALFVLSRIGGSGMTCFRVIMAALPFLLLTEKEYKTVIVNLLLLALFWGMAEIPLFIHNPLAYSICVILSGVFIRFLPAIAAADYTDSILFGCCILCKFADAYLTTDVQTFF